MKKALKKAAHLEHFQSIFIEFDFVGASIEFTIIWYFREGLKPFIKAQIDECSRELDSFKELVKKTVEIKAKTTQQSGSYVCETDYRYLWSTCPTYITKVQGSSKNLKPEKPKSRPQKSKVSNLQ